MLFHFKNNTATLWKLHPSQMNFCLSPSTSPFLSGTMPSVSEPRAVGRSHGSLNEAAFPYAHRSHTDIFMIVPILQFPSAFTTQGDICVFSYSLTPKLHSPSSLPRDILCLLLILFAFLKNLYSLHQIISSIFVHFVK